MSNLDELEKLDQLRRRGELSGAEFDAAKKKLLSDASFSATVAPPSQPTAAAIRPRKTVPAAIVAVCAVGAVLFIAFSGDGNSGIDYSNMCTSPRVQSWAADAVKEKIGLAGLGVVDRSAVFANLKIVHDATSDAVKRQASRVKDVPIDDVQVCAPNGDVSAYTTIVIRSGNKVGGEVLNFGIPGAVAPFGDLPLGH